MNTSIQGTGIRAREKIAAFTNKILTWRNCIGCRNLAKFPNFDKNFNSKDLLQEGIVTDMKEHLQMLSQSFQGYFYHGEISVSQGWMQDPFFFNIDFMDDNDKIKEELVQMKASNKTKMEFDLMQLDTF